MKKIIAVVGATGAQGGGLIRAILNDPASEFTPRAITRNIHSEKAKALAAAGAELVAADIDDPKSVTEAFRGAYGAFCITFFWEHLKPELETAQAGTMAAAAKAAGIKHVVWSTLDDTRLDVPLSDNRMPTLHGKYKVPHFDAKADGDAFFRQAGVPTTFLYTTFYWENFIYFGQGPKKNPDGSYSITFPMGSKKLAGIASEDIGKCTYGIFKRGGALIGKKVGIAGEHLTGAAMAASLARALGIDVRYNEVTPDVYRSFGFPGADESGNMFQYYRDFEEKFCRLRDVGFSRSLNPALLTFDAWLAINKKRIPIE